MDLNGNIIDQVEYSDAAPWPQEPDGNGPSLTFCDPAEDNNVGENWYASVHVAGQNSQEQTLYATPGEICEFVGVSEPQKNGISIFPNPGNGLFSIDFATGDPRTISIYSLTGKIIFEVQVSEAETVVDLRDRLPGIYMMRATNVRTGEIITKKLIIN